MTRDPMFVAQMCFFFVKIDAKRSTNFGLVVILESPLTTDLFSTSTTFFKFFSERIATAFPMAELPGYVPIKSVKQDAAQTDSDSIQSKPPRLL